VPEPEFVTEDQSFVTVAEAARALQLSERQARRRAAVLQATGRTRTDGRTRLVTVADMMTVRPDTDKKNPPASTDASAETTGRTDGHDRMTDRTDIKNDRTDVRMEELRSELEAEKRRSAVLEAQKQGAEDRAALLERELGDWKSQAQELTQALQRAQDEARAARVMSSGRVVQQIEPSGFTGDTQSGDTAPGGPLDTQGTSEAQEGKRAGFWAMLFRRGG
jgi:chromosome segregation ATPase